MLFYYLYLTVEYYEAPMKLRWLTILIGIVISLAPAQAQVGIYGNFNSTRVNATNSANTQTTNWYNGVGAGVYYDFFHMGPLALGADLRGSRLSGNQQNYHDGLFGLRLAANPPVLPIRPYVQASIGAGGASHSGLHGSGKIYSNKFQYQVLAGVDYTLIPHLDLRLAELGYGRMTGVSDGITNPDSTLFSISSGLVVRFR